MLICLPYGPSQETESLHQPPLRGVSARTPPPLRGVSAGLVITLLHTQLQNPLPTLCIGLLECIYVPMHKDSA